MIKSPSWFDFPMACLGALVSGAIVAWINIEHGYLPASTAATKQATYAFFATGLILQLCRWLALRAVAPMLAAAMAVLLPLAITITALFTVHSLKGTPEPIYSILPGTALSLLGLVLITWRTLNGTASPAEPPVHAPKTAEKDS